MGLRHRNAVWQQMSSRLTIEAQGSKSRTQKLQDYYEDEMKAFLFKFEPKYNSITGNEEAG